MAGVLEGRLIGAGPGEFGEPGAGEGLGVDDGELVVELVLRDPGQPLDHRGVGGDQQGGEGVASVGVGLADGLDHQGVALPAGDRIAQRRVGS